MIQLTRFAKNIDVFRSVTHEGASFNELTEEFVAMAAGRLSPTANLLRQSRLFSLPPPLPRPSHDPFTATVLFESDTATLPYPTHAAIETTQSSLSRGDWGLKRPLPQKSMASTTTPTIRVHAIDSIDHITDYDSAADHALTLRKWQELDIPVSMDAALDRFGAYRSFSRPAKSVFEDELNSTEASGTDEVGDKKRWKYKGPWLAGKTGGEFQDYVNGEIKRRRPEFQKFVRKWLEGKKAASLLQAATADGKRAEAVSSKAVGVSDEELRQGIIKLRQETTDLWVLIWEFLDLPGQPPQPATHVADEMANSNGLSTAAADIDQGPPTTHPSAGLSYLRTASTVRNHPLLGPMIHPPPVQGRVLQYATTSGGPRTSRVLVGVAGVVATDDADKPFHENRTKDTVRFDPDVVGGSKIWVHPRRATIDSKGRIKLAIHRATPSTLTVWEVEESKKPELDDVVKGVDKIVPDLSPSSENSSLSRSLEEENRAMLRMLATKKDGVI